MADPESQGGQARYRKKKTEGTSDPWGNVSLDGKARTADQKEQESAPVHAFINRLLGNDKKK